MEKSRLSVDVWEIPSRVSRGEYRISYIIDSIPDEFSSLLIRYHGKEEVKEGGRYHISLEKDQVLYHMARLEIKNVITGDKGEYRAVARNKHGEGVATINLNFEGSGKPK